MLEILNYFLLLIAQSIFFQFCNFRFVFQAKLANYSVKSSLVLASFWSQFYFAIKPSCVLSVDTGLLFGIECGNLKMRCNQNCAWPDVQCRLQKLFITGIQGGE